MKLMNPRRMLILFILSVCLSLFSGIASAETPRKLKVEVDIGYDNYYKINHQTPIKFTIKNNLKDINGEIEIRVPNDAGRYLSFVKSINLKKGSEKTITINIPMTQNRLTYNYYIYDGKELIYDDLIRAQYASNDVTCYIGILSDDFSSLSYIDQVSSSSTQALITKLIKLDEKIFPEDSFALDNFDIIVVNDFDTSKLNKKQYENLKRWVYNGKLLVIGTGAKYSKTLAAFKDNFIEGKQGILKSIRTGKIYDFTTNGDSKTNVNVEALAMNIKNASVKLQDQGIDFIQKLEKGRGAVGIIAFDLASEPFNNWSNNTTFMEKTFNVLGNQATVNTSYNDMYQNMANNLSQVFNQFSEFTAANMNLFYILLLVYIFLVAPVSYFVLKKLDKRDLMWIVVPAMAIAFALIINIAGSSSRTGGITTNMVSYIDLDNDGYASMETYAGIMNSNKADINVKSKNGNSITVMTNNNYYSGNQKSNNDVMQAKTNMDTGVVEYRNNGLLDSKMLNIQEDIKKIGKIDAKLMYSQSKISGTITNSTNLELQDCLVVGTGFYYFIDQIKPNETVSLSKYTQNKFSNNDVFQTISDEYFRVYNSSNMTEKERKRVADKQLEGNMLQSKINILSNYGFGSSMNNRSISFLGFSKTQIHDPLLVNDSVTSKNERNLVYVPLTVTYADKNYIQIPSGYIPFNIVNSNGVKFDTGNGILYGSGDVELIYHIDNSIDVNEVVITPGTMMKTRINIYNVKKKKYVVLSSDMIKGSLLKNYLNSDNTIKLKFEVKNDGITAPKMGVTGRAK